MYTALILEHAPNHDPRHIEAYMRLAHPTLDGLSRKEFVKEVIVCALAVDMDGPDTAAELADVMGIPR